MRWLGAVVFCAALLSLEGLAMQNASPGNASSANASPTNATPPAPPPTLEGLQQQVNELKARLDSPSQTVPWIVLGVVAIGFTFAWFRINWLERVLEWHKASANAPPQNLGQQLTDMQTTLDQLRQQIREINTAVNAQPGLSLRSALREFIGLPPKP